MTDSAQYGSLPRLRNLRESKTLAEAARVFGIPIFMMTSTLLIEFLCVHVHYCAQKVGMSVLVSPPQKNRMVRKAIEVHSGSIVAAH